MTEQTVALPRWGELVGLHVDDWHSLPDTATPYYVAAKNGTFLHRRTVLGRGILRSYKLPPALKPIEAGEFTFDADPIPASIYAQAVHFFRRIFEKHHTEAEVIITQHLETKQYRLFVPHQRVSHGGVYSIYNPAHITRDHLVVGTFHSHCDFSAYHSGTDEGDARDMDGIHGTIGFLTREQPELALMVALNGQFFHFKEFAGVVDTTDLAAATAPEWWDRYVILGQVTDEHRQRIAPYADNETWERFMGRYRKPQPQPQAKTPPYTYTPRPTPQTDRREFRWFDDDDVEVWYSRMLHESREFNQRQPKPPQLGDGRKKGRKPLAPRPIWDEEGALLVDASDYWEDALGSEYVDSLFDTGLFGDEDLDRAIEDWPKSGKPQYWEGRMKNKLYRAVGFLRRQGLDVKVLINDDRIPVVPGQTSIDDHTKGVQP